MSDDNADRVVKAARDHGKASAEVGTMLDSLDETGLVKVIEQAVGDLHGVRAGAQARLEALLGKRHAAAMSSLEVAINRFNRSSTRLAIGMIVIGLGQIALAVVQVVLAVRGR